MNKKNKISVILSTYNTDFVLLKRAIDSVLSQNFQDFEIILVDDGSDSGTQNQILNYSIIHEDKITYIRHKNRGQSNSINQGILNCNGDYITFLDADDTYKVNHLNACLNEMDNVDLIASTAETIVDKEEDNFVPDRFDNSKMIHVDECILFATLFGRKEVFENLFFQDMYAADANFYDSAAEKFKVKKVDLRTYIYYRNIPGSISSLVKNRNL